MKNVKTNAIRILGQKKAVFQVHSYEPDGVSRTGVEVAELLGQETAAVYKTLVTCGKSGANYVFVIPVAAELDLKKAAGAAGEKSIAMLKSRDLLNLTGYIHGGCSPIGMKKLFPTWIDRSAEARPTILVSGGRIGMHIEISLSELRRVLPFQLAGLV